MDCSPQRSSVHCISQAIILEWGCLFLFHNYGVFLTNLSLIYPPLFNLIVLIQDLTISYPDFHFNLLASPAIPSLGRNGLVKHQSAHVTPFLTHDSSSRPIDRVHTLQTGDDAPSSTI